MAEYILRDDAEKALLERCKETGYGGLTPDDIRLVMRTPWRIPAADVVERKKGRWINKYPLSTCSVCEQTMILHDFANFCPNCGADMRIFSANCKNTATAGEAESGEM